MKANKLVAIIIMTAFVVFGFTCLSLNIAYSLRIEALENQTEILQNQTEILQNQITTNEAEIRINQEWISDNQERLDELDLYEIDTVDNELKERIEALENR